MRKILYISVNSKPEWESASKTVARRLIDEVLCQCRYKVPKNTKYKYVFDSSCCDMGDAKNYKHCCDTTEECKDEHIECCENTHNHHHNDECCEEFNINGEKIVCKTEDITNGENLSDECCDIEHKCHEGGIHKHVHEHIQECCEDEHTHNEECCENTHPHHHHNDEYCDNHIDNEGYCEKVYNSDEECCEEDECDEYCEDEHIHKYKHDCCDTIHAHKHSHKHECCDDIENIYCCEDEDECCDEWEDCNEFIVEEVDLYKEDIPILTHEFYECRNTLVEGPGPCYESLTHVQRRDMERIRALAQQFKEADIYIIAAPMWSLLFPAPLKQYLDCVILNGVTAEINEKRCKGLLDDKERKMVFVQSVGAELPLLLKCKMDHSGAYLKDISKFLGISKFEELLVDGTGYTEEDKKCAIDEATKDIKYIAKCLIK